MGGRATMYDAYRLADDYSLRRLPRLVREATSLVWRAAPRELATAIGVQILSAAGVVVQLLVGRAVLESILSADRLDRDVWSVLPGLVALLVVTAVVSFAATVRNQLQGLLVELTSRHAQGRVLDVAAAVDLEAFEDPDFHDGLQRAQAGATSRPWMMTSNLISLLGAAIGAIGLLVALAALHPLLLPLALLAYVPTWLAATRNSRDLYRFGYTMTPDDRRRWALSFVFSGRPHAAEVRAFQLAGFLRRQYEDLYERRVQRLREDVRTRMRRALVASLVTSALGAATMGVLVALLLSGHPRGGGCGGGGDRRPAAERAAVGHGVERQRAVRGRPVPRRPVVVLRPGAGGGSSAAHRPAAARVRHLGGGGRLVRLSGVRPVGTRRRVVRAPRRRGRGPVGENGSGKTTLAKLLCNLYRPTSGRITWDGVDLATCSPPELGRHVAVIFQDFVQYFMSAADNIAVGGHTGAHDRSRVEAAAAQSGADEFLAALADGYDTMLGRQFEGGHELSIGQWQRVALARAFFRAAPLLILDEPTAASTPGPSTRSSIACGRCPPAAPCC